MPSVLNSPANFNAIKRPIHFGANRESSPSNVPQAVTDVIEAPRSQAPAQTRPVATIQTERARQVAINMPASEDAFSSATLPSVQDETAVSPLQVELIHMGVGEEHPQAEEQNSGSTRASNIKNAANSLFLFSTSSAISAALAYMASVKSKDLEGPPVEKGIFGLLCGLFVMGIGVTGFTGLHLTQNLKKVFRRN